MNNPINPWVLLELDRTTAGEREVKRAYARLLKRHRPEQDPEGFRRVNEAYQAALGELARGRPAVILPVDLPANVGGPLPDVPVLSEESPVAERGAPLESKVEAALPEVIEAPTPPVDAGLWEVFEATKANLLKRLGLLSSTGEFPEFNRLRNLVRENPVLMERWVELLVGLVDGPAVGQIVYGLHPEDIWLMMREGQGQFAADVVLQWRHDIALLGRVQRLGLLLLEQATEAERDAPERVQAMHFVARVAAFYLPEIAGKLADELYHLMGPGARDEMVREIEIRAAAGRSFSHFSLPVKHFWEHQLFETGRDETVDWSEPQRLAAVREVVQSCPRDWEGWGVVQQVVPEAVLQPLIAQRRKQPKPVYQTELAPENPWWNFGGRWTWILIFLVVKAIVLGLNSSNSGADSRNTRQTLEELRANLDAERDRKKFGIGEFPAEEAQRKLDEILQQRSGGKNGPALLPLTPGPNPPQSPFLTPTRGENTWDRKGSETDSRFRLDGTGN